MDAHNHKFYRRNFLWTAATFTASTALVHSQERPTDTSPPAGPTLRKSVVSVANGSSRRQNVNDALAAIEDQIMPALKTKKRVVIKPNLVSTDNQLAATHVDALHGILDFLDQDVEEARRKYYVVNTAFLACNPKMGYAAATAFVLFAIILLLTILQFRTAEGRVVYE